MNIIISPCSGDNAFGLCQVKAYHTELDAASFFFFFCMAINEIHHSQMHPTTTLVVANEILIIFMAHLTLAPIQLPTQDFSPFTYY